MKWTNAKIGSRLALLGLTGLFAPAAFGAGEINCQPKIGLDPQITNPDQNCSSGDTAREGCRKTHELISQKYQQYITTLRTKCQEANQQLKSIGTVQQKNAQGKTKEISGNAAAAMEALVQEGRNIQKEVMQATKRNNYDPLVALPQGESHPPARGWASRFSNREAFASGALQIQPLPGKPKANAHIAAIKKATEFANKLGSDISEREGSATKLKSMSETAGQNEENGGPEKDEKGGKGMDPSALAGPLAGLAGMAGQQANKGSDSSGLTDPLANQNPAGTTTPENVTPAPATVKAANVATNKAGASTDASKTGGGGKNGAGFENSPGAGSGLSAGSGSGPYPDAFTGVGPEGTSSSFGGAGTSSFGGGAGAGSSTGASSSPGNGENTAGAEGGGHSEDEALSAFGGGGLNFSGGASSTGSSSSGEEPVKDFLEDAATSFDGTEFAEENGELDGSLESAGVQGEDGTELFRRVRSALERSQRKGAVMSGLGAGHRTR